MCSSERFFILALALMVCLVNGQFEQTMKDDDLAGYIAAAREMKNRRLANAQRTEISLEELEELMTPNSKNDEERTLFRKRIQNKREEGKKIVVIKRPEPQPEPEPEPEPEPVQVAQAPPNAAVEEVKAQVAAKKTDIQAKAEAAKTNAAAKKVVAEGKVGEVTEEAQQKIKETKEIVTASVSELLTSAGLVTPENELVTNLLKVIFPVWVIFFFKPCSSLDVFIGILDSLPLKELKMMCPARHFKPEVCTLDFDLQDSTLVCGSLLHTIDSIFTKLPIRSREGSCVESCQVWYATYCSECEGTGYVAQQKAQTVRARIEETKAKVASTVAAAEDGSEVGN